MIDPKDEAFPTTSIKSLKLLVPHSLLVQYPFCTHKQKKNFFSLIIQTLQKVQGSPKKYMRAKV